MKFKIGDLVRKTKGSEWQGVIVGTYSTELTPVGYCVESSSHAGSVQIYPESVLELVSYTFTADKFNEMVQCMIDCELDYEEATGPTV